MKHSHTFTNFMAATRLCNRSTSHTPESRVRINVTLRRVRLATVGVEKQYVLRILNRCSKPWLSSMQCACAVLGLYGHLWPVWLYPLFSILAHKRHGFRKKKKLLTIKRVFWFPVQLMSETFLILRIIRRHTIRNLHRSSREVPVVLVTSLIKPEFSQQTFEKYSISNFMKIRPVGAQMFHADGRTDWQTWPS